MNKNKEEPKIMSNEEYDDITEKNAELKIKLEKAEAQRNIASAALIAIIFSYGFLLTPYISIERIEALNGISDMYYIGLATIVAAYFGFTAWMSKR